MDVQSMVDYYASDYSQAIDREAKKLCNRFEWWLAKKIKTPYVGTWLAGLTIEQYPHYTVILKHGKPKVRVYKTGQVIQLEA